MHSFRGSEIKACVFDAYGTLLNLDSVTETLRPRLGDKVEEIATIWRRKQLEYTWLRSLMGRHSDFWHVTGEALDWTLASLGLSDPLLRAQLMQNYLTIRPYPDAAPVLRKCQEAGFRTAILSNGSPTMLTGALSSGGLERLLDKVLTVEECSVYKPHPSVYQLVTDHFDLLPKQVGFVTANGWDAAGASAFGFQVAWINRTNAVPEVLPREARVQIASLSDFLPLLGLPPLGL